MCKFLSSLTAAPVLENYGRRPVMLVGLAAMGLSYAIAGIALDSGSVGGSMFGLCASFFAYQVGMCM